MTSTFTIAVQHPKHNDLTETFQFDIPSYVAANAFEDHVKAIFSQSFAGAPENDPTAWWDETQKRIQAIAEEYNADVEMLVEPFVVKAAY